MTSNYVNHSQHPSNGTNNPYHTSNRIINDAVNTIFGTTTVHEPSTITTTAYNDGYTTYNNSRIISDAIINSGSRSALEEAILNSKSPININETQVVTQNGVTGIWANREECLNWRGPIPLENYAIYNDPNPTHIRRKANQLYQNTQTVNIRYLKPPPLKRGGDIIIKQEPDVQLPPAPPLIIRQAATTSRSVPPVVIRERPPKVPELPPTQVITIPGKTLPPPPRQLIVERMPPAPAASQSVLIERWLGYPAQTRNVVYQQSAKLNPLPAPKNVFIEWEAENVDVATKQQFNFLGVEEADPYEYERRYHTELVESHRLPDYVSEIKVPSGEVLAVHRKMEKPQLVGDVKAISLLSDKEREQINEYLSHKF